MKQMPGGRFRAGSARQAGVRRARRPPNGAVMVAVLVCVGLAGLMTLAIVRQAAVRRAEVELAGRALQAHWLAEAALERAAARLAEDPAFRTERWHLAAGTLGAADGAVVQIEVQPATGRADLRRIRIVADYPDDPLHRVRVSKETTWEIQPKTARPR